jgi:hypothetical protein
MGRHSFVGGSAAGSLDRGSMTLYCMRQLSTRLFFDSFEPPAALEAPHALLASPRGCPFGRL